MGCSTGVVLFTWETRPPFPSAGNAVAESLCQKLSLGSVVAMVTLPQPPAPPPLALPEGGVALPGSFSHAHFLLSVKPPVFTPALSAHTCPPPG